MVKHTIVQRNGPRMCALMVFQGIQSALRSVKFMNSVVERGDINLCWAQAGGVKLITFRGETFEMQTTSDSV